MKCEFLRVWLSIYVLFPFFENEISKRMRLSVYYFSNKFIFEHFVDYLITLCVLLDFVFLEQSLELAAESIAYKAFEIIFEGQLVDLCLYLL